MPEILADLIITYKYQKIKLFSEFLIFTLNFLIYKPSKSWSKGEETMSKRGENIYKRKDGRYEGRFIKGYDSQGKAIKCSVYAKTYAGVKSKLAEYKSAPSHTDMVLSEWLKLWLDAHENIKYNTKSHYKNIIYNHLIPEMGKIKLKKLNYEHIQTFINKKSMSLSPLTVSNIFGVFKSALKSAMDEGYINCVWNNIKLPQKQQSEIRILTRAEQDRLDIILSENEDIGILLSLYTGLRIGEVCALKWEDINFETSTLSVKSTQIRTKQGIEITSPKTKNSYREIPLMDFLIEKLQNMPHECEFVLSRNKKAFDVRTYRNYFKRKLKEANIPDICYHALRHTFASRALELNIDIKTVCDILGHSDEKITMNIYIHSLKEHKAQMMKKMEVLHYEPSKKWSNHS